MAGNATGTFAPGSTLKIILANGADLQAKGGDGGKGEGIFRSGTTVKYVLPTNGKNAGTVFDANGVTCDIYFSGATSEAAPYDVADGYILAPGGGDGGKDSVSFDPELLTTGNGGNGGDGRAIGFGGPPGSKTGTFLEFGDVGNVGTDNRLVGLYGVNGANNDASGGLMGKGIIDNGATVTLHGDNAVRYINGSGDH